MWTEKGEKESEFGHAQMGDENPDKMDRNKPRVCKNCKKIFFPRARGKMPDFCSNDCAISYRKQNPQFKKRCLQCGNEFETNLKTQKYCCVECSREARRGRTVYDKECLFCGKQFQTIYPKYKFCSSTCGSRWAADQRRGEYFCEYCGKPRHSDHPNRNRFCSISCAVKARALRNAPLVQARRQERERLREQEWQEKHNKICPICGKPFIEQVLSRIYCSDECANEALFLSHHKKYVDAYTPRHFFCEECGAEITTEVGDRRRRYCSESCQKRASDREYSKKREKQMNEAFVENVCVEDLYEKSEGVCEICGLPVPRDHSPENVWAATRDHIIPLSKGGLHEKSNCQLAHRLCNSLKLDTTDAFKINWSQKLIDEPGRWNEQIDDLWRQLGVEWVETEENAV